MRIHEEEVRRFIFGLRLKIEDNAAIAFWSLLTNMLLYFKYNFVRCRKVQLENIFYF